MGASVLFEGSGAAPLELPSRRGGEGRTMEYAGYNSTCPGLLHAKLIIGDAL
jgi:hypothetical protein